MDFGFTAIPAITALCYLAAEVFKILIPSATEQQADDAKRIIPTLCGVLGAVLGVFCYMLWPEFIAAENPLVAAAIGLVSGFAATGVNQIFKQFGGSLG